MRGGLNFIGWLSLICLTASALNFAISPAATQLSKAPAEIQANEVDVLTKQIEELLGSGRYGEAISLAQQILAIQEKTLGLTHTQVAAALNQVAALYYLEERYADAEPLFKRALKILDKGLRPNNPKVITSLNNLGLLTRLKDAMPTLSVYTNDL